MDLALFKQIDASKMYIWNVKLFDIIELFHIGSVDSPLQEKRYSDLELGNKGSISEEDYQQETGSKVQIPVPKEPPYNWIQSLQRNCRASSKTNWKKGSKGSNIPG